MKYMKRSNTYKANNVTFDVDSKAAYSYGWWKFVGIVNGKVVFNNYTYSNSTAKHQSKVRSLLRELNINIDLTIQSHPGLQCSNEEVAKSALRKAYLDQDFQQVKAIEKVFKVSLTEDEIQTVYTHEEERLCNEYLQRALKYQQKKEAEQSAKAVRELTEYLEQNVCFRDYDIYPAEKFGSINSIAVHQLVDLESMEHDVQNALHSFHRDGFGSICFYIG